MQGCSIEVTHKIILLVHIGTNLCISGKADHLEMVFNSGSFPTIFNYWRLTRLWIQINDIREICTLIQRNKSYILDILTIFFLLKKTRVDGPLKTAEKKIQDQWKHQTLIKIFLWNHQKTRKYIRSEKSWIHSYGQLKEKVADHS